MGVPWRSVDQWYQRELKLSAEGIRKYEQSTYYVGRWKARIGHYDVLGKQAAQLIPGARLVEFPGKGHAPQMEDPVAFNKALVERLDSH